MSIQPPLESESLDEASPKLWLAGGQAFLIMSLTDSSQMVFKTNMFPLNPFKSQTLMIASKDESTLSSNRIVCTSSDIGNSRIDHGRIGTPNANKNIWSVDDKFNVRSDVGKADKLDTIVQRSPTNKGNMASLQIEEESFESIFSKIVE